MSVMILDNARYWWMLVDVSGCWGMLKAKYSKRFTPACFFLRFRSMKSIYHLSDPEILEKNQIGCYSLEFPGSPFPGE